MSSAVLRRGYRRFPARFTRSTMSMFRFLGLLLTFGLLGGLVRAADEPSEKNADDPPKNSAKSPSDKSAADKASGYPLKPDDEYYELFRSFADTVDQVERNYVQ